MKKILFIFVAAIAVLSSCSKANVDQKSDNDTSITKGAAQATINEQNVLVKWVQLWKNGPKFAEYNVGVTDGKAESLGEFCTWAEDVVSSRWGGKWRLPTRGEFQGLLDNCKCDWAKLNNVWGLKCTGKDEYGENSVFFPSTIEWDYEVDDWGDYFCGRYWSSDHDDLGHSAFLFFYSDRSVVGVLPSHYQFSIRAVLAE